jgi:hypothetical protein
VCISHASGAAGEEVGRLVAEALAFLLVDEEVVAGAAASGGIAHEEVASEERRKSLATRLVEALGHGGDPWAVLHGGAAAPEGPSSDEIRALIRETIAQTAARGQVVIVAHGASHVVPPGPAALRVLVTASPQTRARRIAAAASLDEKGAKREVERADAARRDYLERFYGIDDELPTYYDLVVNTDVFSVEQAARLIAQAASG